MEMDLEIRHFVREARICYIPRNNDCTGGELRNKNIMAFG